jgi:hypothetical protein
MRLAAKQINDPDVEWLAGGMPVAGYSLGGHIHFSRVPCNPELLRALDNYFALPLVLVEAETTARRRPKYGYLGDFRRQPHGGFEYRTLPSWIVSPKAAKGVVALAAVIAEEYEQLRSRPLGRFELLKAYYSGDKNVLWPHAVQLIDEIRKTAVYMKYRMYIEPLLQQIYEMRSWNEQEDLRKLWKIPPYT